MTTLTSAPPAVIEIEQRPGSEGQPLAELDGGTRALMFGLAGVLLFGPLAFGGMEAWATGIMQIWVVALFLFWAGNRLRLGYVETVSSPLYAPALLFAAVVAAQTALSLSAYPYVTRVEAMKYVMYALLMVMATQLSRFEKALPTLILILAGFGFLLAVFALVQDFTSNGKLYWLREPRFGGTIYGPYVNRNHFAGVMELLFPLPLCLMLLRSLSLAQRALCGTLAAFMLVALFFSGSRGGIAAGVAALLFLGVVMTVQGRGKVVAASLATLLALVVGLLFWLDASASLDRWMRSSAKEEAEVGRWAITRDALRMVPEHPVLGSGLGTFATVYPRYRTFYTDLLVNEAHNDVVQVLVETGVMGATAMAWFVFVLFRHGLRGRRGAGYELRDAIRLGALTGCAGLVVHSFFDFNLHIPGNAAMFFVLAAIASAPPRKATVRIFSRTTAGRHTGVGLMEA
jgi:O-antigen ligase